MMRGGTRRRRVVGHAVIALLLAVVLAACSGLATSGPVRPGLRVDSPVEQREVQQLPSGPRPGAPADEVLTDFLRASAISFGDVTVARSYLTESANQAWAPDQGTVIRGNDEPIVRTSVGGGRFTVSTRVVATIDEVGRMTVGQADERRTAQFRLSRPSGGEWRISELPSGFGRWMTRAESDDWLRPFNLYYQSRSTGILIPQRRWFPLTGIVSRLAREQLAGAPAYLRGATFADPPVRLAGDLVAVRDGVASVPVQASDVVADPDRRRRLYAELAATLTQVTDLPDVASVAAVEITADGVLLEAEGVAPPVATPEEVGATTNPPTTTGTPLVRRGNRLYPTTFDALVGNSEPAPAPADLPALTGDPELLAQSQDGTEIAWTDRTLTHVHRARADARGQVTGFGIELTRPMYDTLDWLWVSGRSRDGSAGLWALAAADPPTARGPQVSRITVPSLARNRFIRAARVSPDGAQIALLTTDQRGRDTRLEVAGIVRRADGRPWRLSRLTRTIVTPFEDIRDVVWINLGAVGVLSNASGERAPRAAIVELGGYDMVLGGLAGAESIMTFGSRRTLVLQSESGLYVRAGNGWKAGSGGQSLTVPLR